MDPFWSHVWTAMEQQKNKNKNKLRGFSPQANYTDRATAVVGQVSANFSG
jgi:hypothetical protein